MISIEWIYPCLKTAYQTPFGIAPSQITSPSPAVCHYYAGWFSNQKIFTPFYLRSSSRRDKTLRGIILICIYVKRYGITIIIWFSARWIVIAPFTTCARGGEFVIVLAHYPQTPRADKKSGEKKTIRMNSFARDTNEREKSRSQRAALSQTETRDIYREIIAA